MSHEIPPPLYTITLRAQDRKRLMYAMAQPALADDKRPEDVWIISLLENALPQSKESPVMPVYQDSTMTAQAMLVGLSRFVHGMDGKYFPAAMQKFYFTCIKAAAAYLQYRLHPQRIDFEEGRIKRLSV